MKTDQELHQIAQELHDIIKQKGVTLDEAEEIYCQAGVITRTSDPALKELYDKWRNAPVK